MKGRVDVVSQNVGTRIALYLAAGLGAVVSTLLLLFVLLNPRGIDYAESAYVALALAIGFYAGLALFAERLSHARKRRWWLGLSAFISLTIAVMGGGPAGLVVFGVPTAILVWLAIRG